MQNKRILISGAGIGGPILAYWLHSYGFTPTVVERAPALRGGGFAIDIREAAIDVTDKMGILPRLKQKRVDNGKMLFVSKNNSIKGVIDMRALKKIAPGRWIEIMREDVGKLIYAETANEVEYIFDNTIEEIKQNEDGVYVRFKHNHNKAQYFDIVIGADGLHSVVRKLVFGKESQFEKFLEYYVVAFSVNNFLKLDKFKSGYMYNVPGKMAAVMQYKPGKTIAFFIFKEKQKLNFDAFDVVQQKQIVLDQFKDEKWEIPTMLEMMKQSSDFYFDVVSQIKMDKWSEGRVALVGDAAYCPSLLTGQGTTLAMIGAYILAGELKKAQGNFQLAFKNYEDKFRSFVEKEQRIIGASSKMLVPENNLIISIRNKLTYLTKLISFMPRGIVSKLVKPSAYQIHDY